MPRKPREKSISDIYHVVLRGADRRIIFSDDEDYEKFLCILRRTKTKSEYQLYSYCLMSNHVHMLIKEGTEPLGLIFKRIGVSYVGYYNRKYDLRGHLFQDRFRSENVEDDAYFLDVLRYICQNPVKAGVSESPFDYPWLGCSGLMGDSALLDSIRPYTDMSSSGLQSFVTEECKTQHLDDRAYRRLTDREAIEIVKKSCGCENVQEIAGWEKKRREEEVRRALRKGVSIRQLSRITGISKPVIARIWTQAV